MKDAAVLDRGAKAGDKVRFKVVEEGGGGRSSSRCNRPSEPEATELTARFQGGSTRWGSSPTQSREIPQLKIRRGTAWRTLIGSIPAGALMARPTGASPKLLARLMQPACKRGTCHLRQPGSKGGRAHQNRRSHL
jgi:hypothetical protein